MTVSIGLVADRLPSKQTPFLWGLLVLAMTTLAFAAGRTLPILVFARVLQGLSSAIVFCVGFAILFDAVGKERMGTVSGWTSFSISLGSLIGPVLGGFLYEYAGYFQVFLPAVGLIIVDIIMRFMYRPGKKQAVQPTTEIVRESTPNRSKPTTDQYGTDSQVAQRESSMANAESDPLLVDSPSDPLSPQTHRRFLGYPGSSILTLLSTPRFLASILGVLYLCSVPAGLDATLPVYLKDSFGLSASQTAPFFMLLGAPLILSPLSGVMVDRLGPKTPASLAFACLTLAMFGLPFVTPELAGWRPVLLVLLAFAGLGATFGFPPLTADVGHTVAAIEAARPGRLGPGGAYSQAYGLMNAASASGSVVGPLYAGMMKDKLGWCWTMTSFGLMAVGLFVLVISLTGGNPACSRRSIQVGDDQDEHSSA